MHSRYLGVEAHGILGSLVELWVLQHVLFPAAALEYPQGQWRQGCEDLYRLQKNITNITTRTEATSSAPHTTTRMETTPSFLLQTQLNVSKQLVPHTLKPSSSNLAA